MGFGYGRGYDDGAHQSQRLTRLYGGKPKKTVFDTTQCAHVWAQQNQDWGRNAKGTVYFERETIYSYGHHFPMARFARADVVLINRAKYSVSTSSHQRDVESAIRHKKQFSVENCLAQTKAEHGANLKDYKESFEAGLKTARNSRVNLWGRRCAMESLPGIVREANEYARLFLRKRKNVIELPADFDWLASEIEKAGKTREQKRALREYAEAKLVCTKMYGARRVITATRDAKRNGATFKPIDAKQLLRVWRAAKKAYAFLDFARASYNGNVVITAQASWDGNKNAIERFDGNDYRRPRGFQAFDRFAQRVKSDAEIEAERLARAERERHWQAEQAQRERQRAEGKEARERLKNASADALCDYWRQTGIDATNGRELSDWPCMLRVVDDVIFTSWGANFPTSHAVKAWPAIKRVFASGKPWHTNGHKIPLGHFHVDSIDPNESGGTLRAGCHTLTKAEVENCARLLGLIVE